jgi:glycosyl transferase family 25
MTTTMLMPKEQARPVNDWVDAVYVLSVKTFASRIAHIKEQLANHHITFQFMFDHDADELDEQLLANVFGPSDLKATHQSLVLKNIAVWRDAAANNYHRILVFEDDAVLAKDFVTRFDTAMTAASKLPDGWLIFLGGADVKVPDHFFLAPGPLVELPMPTAEGCVSDITAIRRRLAWLESNKATLPADHLTHHIDQLSGIRQYWLTHPIVEQGSTIGLFDSVLDGHRQKHSRSFNILRNRWNKFRRQRLRGWLVRLKAKIRTNFTSSKITR